MDYEEFDWNEGEAEADEEYARFEADLIARRDAAFAARREELAALIAADAE